MLSVLQHPVGPPLRSGSMSAGTGYLTPVSPGVDINKLARLSDLSPSRALRAATVLLTQMLRDPLLVGPQILPLLAAPSGDVPYVAKRYEAEPGDTSLQVFVWPADTATQIHDHSCWGAFCCIAGTLIEERYERLDDGSRPNSARLKRRWRKVWRLHSGVSTLLPYEGGIHRVRNASRAPAISVHLYGPVGDVDGRDYDPSRDYVCDRLV